MKNKWLVRNKNVNEDLSFRLLSLRNVSESEQNDFLYPTKRNLINPFLLKGMKKTVKRIIKAKEKNELICIYGDYDVDGISSVSILTKTFDFLGIKSIFYIPKRIEEGYGINFNAVDYIKSMGTDLIITVDCGITSIEEINYANKKDLDVIITDHHECKDELPDAITIVNPKQNDCAYPYKHLCGAGIALKLAQALIQNIDSKLFDELIEIASIATIADIVELSGENRTIVKIGLSLLKNPLNTGLKSLMEISGIKPANINSSNIAFTLGPRINSTGRMGAPELGVKLIIEDNYEKSILMARKIEEMNRERQIIELKIFEEAVKIIESNSLSKKVFVVSSPDWHSGVIGIVASKLTEKYNRPTFVIAIEENVGKCSARSIDGFNLFENLIKLEHFLIKFGGHNQAAGVTLNADMIENFDKSINALADEILTENNFQRVIEIDSKMNLKDINFETIKTLSKFEPFGIGNKKPLFCLTNHKLSNYRYIGKTKKHFKSELSSDIEMIGFNKIEIINTINLNLPIDLVFELDMNSFNNKNKIQMLIRDIRNSFEYPQVFENIYNKLQNLKNLMLKKEDYIEINKDEQISFNQMLELIGNKLIIVNTSKSYFDLIERLFFLNLTMTFNSLDFNKEYTILLSPIVDNLELSRYNNIIIYESDSFLSSYNINENNIKIMNIDYKRNNFKPVIPKRNIFIDLYNVIINKSTIKFYIFQTCDYFGISVFDFFIILDAFKELELIDFNFEFSKEFVIVKARPKTINKKKLEDTKTIKSLDFTNLFS